MAAFGGNESCPNCSARMAPDQRYCLNCGHRRGEPRLPFMDAVVFMESMNGPAGGGATPPPPPSPQKSSPRMNANAALIAGVATLVLAIGVGFLIGRSGHENSQQAAATPQVIKVEGNTASGGETAEAAAPEGKAAGTGAKKNAKAAKGKTSGKPAKSVKPSEVKEGSEQEKELAKEKTNEVLHTENGVEIETGAQVGGKCKTGAAGCSESGEFTGEFFGE
jgi:type IV secretory pathway VirB10-like protein